MQRTMKKTFSFVLALALVFTMCIGIFSTQAQAAETNLIIQVNNDSGEKTEEEMAGYQYIAYQIFSGDYSEDGSLSNITWGDDIVPGNITDSVAASLVALFTPLGVDTDGWSSTYLQSDEGARAVAAALEYIASDSANAKTFATIISACVGQNAGTLSTISGIDGKATFTGLEDGYYLVETVQVPEGVGAYSDYMLITVGGGEDVTKTDKEDVTHSDKTVDDINDSDLTDKDANIKGGKSADYDIGDDVPFTLIGYVSQNYTDFTNTGIPYTTTFHDVMTDGLTFNDDVTVYVVIGEVSYDVTSSGYVTVISSPTDDCSFEVTITDFNAVLSYVSEQYEVTGFNAATDYIKVTFTAELNTGALIGNAKKADSEEDGYYGDGEFGNMNKSWIDFSNDAHNAGSKGSTAEVEVQVFTYTVIVNKYGDAMDVPLAGATFTLEKLYQDGGDDTYEAGGKEYSGTWTTVSVQTATGTNDNIFTWTGIDDGVYKISETVTPDGYNTAEDIYLVVTATHTQVDEGDGYTTTLSVATYDKDGNLISAENGAFNVSSDSSGAASGTITGNVLNLSGSVLPSTGGIGTTIFYIVGAGIVLCAVVVLVTRRRMRRAA